jgi:hypothetical protein
MRQTFSSGPPGLVVWDQPFSFYMAANQDALLLEISLPLRSRLGMAGAAGLGLIEKGEMLPKKPLVTDRSAEYEGLLSSIAELLQRGRQQAAIPQMRY